MGGLVSSKIMFKGKIEIILSYPYYTSGTCLKGISMLKLKKIELAKYNISNSYELLSFVENDFKYP